MKDFVIRKKKTLIASVVIAAGLLLFHLAPLPNALDTQSRAKILLAENGELLAARIADDQQWRFPRSHHLPQKYISALMAFEDRYFYYHPGVNPFSLVRATWSNTRKGRVVSGGSTLSMQLARLIREDPPRTYFNKFIELFLALKLEWHYSKNEILSLYASNAPFGGNTVGISAASWRYFGRHLYREENRELLQLSWAEAALLAVLPNSPALIHPGRSRAKLKAKRDRLLGYLYRQEQLSKNEFELSLLEPIPGKPKAIPRLAPHLLQTLIKKNPRLNLLHSTLDADLQEKILEIGKYSGKQLAAKGVHNLSIVVINNRSLDTSAYIGNITSAENKRLYGSDVDIASRPRSTGSILKPLLYGLMLQSGDILPNTLVPDIPSNFKGFTPENYDHQYRGAVPAREALSRSLNIPAVRMLKKYGIARFHDDLRQMGMSTLFRPADDYGLSLILGGAEGNLWEITQIYARLINTARSDGNINKQQRVQVLKNLHHKDNTKERFPLSVGAAWLSLEALLEVVRPGTERQWRDYSSSQHIAWKTGTSYGLRDAWAIGSNGKYTVGVWAGNAGGEGIAELSGLKTAAPSLFQIFDLLGHSQWINKPEFALKEVQTCVNDGYLASANCKSEASLAPINSHFQQVSPFHKKIQLDSQQSYRVHGGCESINNMRAKSWLILPPAQEFYWRQNHSEFRSLPPWRDDCIAGLANYSDETPMDIVYPLEGSKVYIPNELNGKRGKVIFTASHRDPKAKLFWHVDNNFIRETQLFHDIALNLSPGWHKLILLDELGFRVERWFKILEGSS